MKVNIEKQGRKVIAGTLVVLAAMMFAPLASAGY